MNRRLSKPTYQHLVAALLCLTLAAPTSCAEVADAGTGSIQLALRDGVGGWLRLRIFQAYPTETLSGPTSFDTKCLDAQSRTYELTNIPAGDNQWIVIEAFDSQDCSDASRVEVGYRGAIDISEGTAPYYHVPLYAEGDMTTLPEGLNISASLAKSIEFCSATDSACEDAFPGHACYDELKPEYWCVPSCGSASDCSEFHPRATCQAATGWCVLNSPHPLNLFEPRALGAGGTLSNGDAAFIGGFGKIAAGKLLPGNEAVEIFNHRTGLFERRAVAGIDAWNGAGLAGSTRLPNDRFVLVGGTTEATVSYSGLGADRTFTAQATTGLSDQLLIVDLTANEAGVTTLPAPLADASVVTLNANRFVVLGGLSVNADGNAVASDKVWLCDISDGALTAACTEAGTLAGARYGAATTCLAEDCSSILVVGGRADAASAEVVTIDGDSASSESLTISGELGPLAKAQLCGTRLVAGSAGLAPSTQKPVILERDGATLNVRTVGERALPLWAAVSPPDAAGDCWVAGGIDATGSETATVFRMTAEGTAPNPPSLGRARFGAVTAWITAGPLNGAILYGGGLKLTGTADAGSVDVVRGVEVLKP